MKAEMQESGVLTTILADIALRVAAHASMVAEYREAAERAPAAPSFADALRGGDVRIIAEAKRRSPSAGSIRESTPVSMLAEFYAAGGAAAISVLTEEDRFGGSLDDLFTASQSVALPVLRKDFIISPLQVYEARAAGAAAILLIVRAVLAPQLLDLAALAHDLGLGTLVEIHDASELDTALRCRPTAVGVNARDLETLVMDPTAHGRLLPQIPRDMVAVAESGLSGRADIERVAEQGAAAVLIGTSFARSDEPWKAVSDCVGVPRRMR